MILLSYIFFILGYHRYKSVFCYPFRSIVLIIYFVISPFCYCRSSLSFFVHSFRIITHFCLAFRSISRIVVFKQTTNNKIYTMHNFLQTINTRISSSFICKKKNPPCQPCQFVSVLSSYNITTFIIPRSPLPMPHHHRLLNGLIPSIVSRSFFQFALCFYFSPDIA